MLLQNENSVVCLKFAVIKVTTCGAIGRMGPTAEQCSHEYNKTDSKLSTSPPPTITGDGTMAINLKGIQRWTAPRGGYYT